MALSQNFGLLYFLSIICMIDNYFNQVSYKWLYAVQGIHITRTSYHKCEITIQREKLPSGHQWKFFLTPLYLSEKRSDSLVQVWALKFPYYRTIRTQNDVKQFSLVKLLVCSCQENFKLFSTRQLAVMLLIPHLQLNNGKNK